MLSLVERVCLCSKQVLTHCDAGKLQAEELRWLGVKRITGPQEAAETLEKQGLKEDAIEFYLRVRPQVFGPHNLHALQATVL